jgi:WD40 repeat protein
MHGQRVYVLNTRAPRFRSRPRSPIPAPPPPRPLQVTIAHWQLRDLLHCPYRAGEVFAVNRRRVLRHDLTACRTDVAAELSFEPTSMTVGSGHLAAGGQSSQLDIRRCSSTAHSSGDATFKGHCGGSVNNALRLARDASHHLRLFVCNNDDTVKIFSVRDGALAGVVRCPVAINHCALSPDGALLAAVGDNRHTYVYKATPTGYRVVKVYTEATDAGMGCDWSPGGGGSFGGVGLLAAASQDGLTAVWDFRSDDVVARFRTQLACRSVRFAPAPLDVLAFAEHRGRLHVADARMWPRRQVLHVSGAPELEPDISGVAFSPCGRRLYAGMEDAIVAYHVDSGGRRSFAMAELC